MTELGVLADCILSGQVPDERVPSLVAETPGLAEELERRSRSMSPVLTVEAGRGDSISSPDGLRPADPIADILFDGELMPVFMRTHSPFDPELFKDAVFETTDETPPIRSIGNPDVVALDGCTFFYGRVEPRVATPRDLWVDTNTFPAINRSAVPPFAPLNSPNFPSQGAFAHRLGKQESRNAFQTRGLLLKFLRSLHPPSFLRKLMRK